MRGGAGLGDAMYVRVVAEHLVRKGEKVTVSTPYPAVFEGAGVETMTFSKAIPFDVIAHYADARYSQQTQFRDMCLRAGIKEEIPLRFEWKPKNFKLLAGISTQADGRPVLLVHGGREPFGRTDGLGLDLIPERDAFEAVLSGLRDCFTVGIGDGKRQSYVPAVELDLIGKTSVTDLLDLGTMCDGVVAQVSFCVPLAECFGKPFLGVWAAKGLYGPVSRPLLMTIKPSKILTKQTSRHIVDNEPEEQIRERVSAFRQLVGSR